MAFRRALSTRATIVARQCHPWISHALHNNTNDNESNGPTIVADEASSPSLRSFRVRAKQLGFGFSRDRRFSNTLGSPSYSGLGLGFGTSRNMSTMIDGGSDKFGILSEVVLSDPTVQSSVAAAAATNEVAIAAADSFLPVWFLQHVIDSVHTTLGVNWWAAIALTSLFIRLSTVPLLINVLKSTSKLSIIRPHMEELKNKMEDGTLDTFEGQRQMTKLFKEHGVSPFSPLKGLFIQGPIFVSFFLAIRNMAEKVPSFQHGGAFWFVDLTTPDALYIFPVLTGLTFLITVETNMQAGLEGNPVAGTMKTFSRGMAFLTVPFTMGFPKAIFCYWITSNLFSLCYGIVMKRPGVKKFLELPEIPIAPPSSNSGPPQTFLSFFSDMKKRAEKMAKQAAEKEMAKMDADARAQAVENVAKQQLENQNAQISSDSHSSASNISQRLKTLEKQVKGKKKINKRRVK